MSTVRMKPWMFIVSAFVFCLFLSVVQHRASAVSAYEAEAYNSKNGCNIASTTTGYTGSGYMVFGGNGTYLEWQNVFVPTAGNYTFTFRFSNASGVGKPCTLYVNGESTTALPFPSAGTWRDWRTVNVTVPLNSGNNTLKLMANTGNGGPLLDKMEMELDYEAEANSSQSGCSFASATTGFSGSGYMSYGTNGAFVEWNNVSVSMDGSYTILFRYSNASVVNKPCALYVDGTQVGSMMFAPSAVWSKWQYSSLKVTLGAGIHTVKLIANTGNGGPLLDKMQIEPELKSISWWESMFQSVWSTEYDTYYNDSLTADSYLYYNLAYAIDGNISMYEASNAADKTKYIERALLYVKNVISKAVPSSDISTSQYKDTYLGWPEVSSPGLTVHGTEIPLYESYLWRYVTKLLMVMKNDPILYNTYRTDYEDILAFTEQNIFQKWYSRGTANLYRSNTHMASHWATISMHLYQLSEDPTWKLVYQTVYQNIHLNGLPNYPGPYNSIKKQMITHPNDPSAYYWNYDWGKFDAPGSDASHGGNTIVSIVEAHELNYLWNGADMQKFCNLLINTLWSEENAPVYPYYVDGSGTRAGWFNEGWIKLGRYDPRVQRKMQTHNAGRNTQFYANGALNAKKLGLSE